MTRPCAGCGNPLSRYNPEDRCSACQAKAARPDPREAGSVIGARLCELRRERARP
ncbi:MAG: hypothetical protein ABSB76_26590 [Streptosporangiaceae bacterium]